MPSNGEINAAVKAYNIVWEAAKDIDARTAPAIRNEAMIAALCAAEAQRADEQWIRHELNRPEPTEAFDGGRLG